MIRFRAHLSTAVLALLLGAGVAGAQQPPATATPADTGRSPVRTPGSPVVLGGDTLFRIHSRVGSFTPVDRARAVSGRLDRLIRDPAARFDSVRVVPGGSSADVVAGDLVITTVTAADARAAGTTPETLALEQARRISLALREQGFSQRARIIAVGAIFALLATLATFLVVRALNRLFPRLLARLEEGRATWMPALRIQRLELVSASQLTDAVVWTVKLVRVLVLALLLYISIPIILSFFPWTQGYAERLFDYILTPFARVWAGFVGYVPNVFTIGAIVVVTWYLLKLIRLFFIGLARGTITLSGFYPEWAIPTYKIVRFVVIMLALVAIWPYIPGSDSPAFQGISVILGLLISFGSASAISNIVGGVVLTYMRPFRVGDRVRISDTMGDVVEKTLLVTRIRTIKNVDVAVPNAMVLASHIVNYSSSAKQHGLILDTTVTIGYDVPWRRVHDLLIGAAKATEGVLPEPAPFVLQTSLDDFYVSYQLNAYTDHPARMAALYSALHANIQDAFNAAGVEILSPHYRAARDGNQSTVPADYLPADYRAPSFRVERGGSGPAHGSAGP